MITFFLHFQILPALSISCIFRQTPATAKQISLLFDNFLSLLLSTYLLQDKHLFPFIIQLLLLKRFYYYLHFLFPLIPIFHYPISEAKLSYIILYFVMKLIRLFIPCFTNLIGCSITLIA